MAWELCTSGAAVRKAGVNANSTISASGAALSDWHDEIASRICDVARYDVVSNFGSLTANGKVIATSVATAFIAQQILNYDPTAYTKAQIETMLDVLENNITDGLALLREDKIKTYLTIT